MISTIDLKKMDRTVSPTNKFYQLTSGGWIKRNAIYLEYCGCESFQVLKELPLKQLYTTLNERVLEKESTDTNGMQLL